MNFLPVRHPEEASEDRGGGLTPDAAANRLLSDVFPPNSEK